MLRLRRRRRLTQARKTAGSFIIGGMALLGCDLPPQQTVCEWTARQREEINDDWIARYYATVGASPEKLEALP
jgi:hypothetical protein